MDDNAKKRKIDDVEDLITEPETLQKAWSMMKQTGPYLFTSLSAYIEWMVEKGKDVTELMAAVYFKSASMENKFVVPREFQEFAIDRDKKGAVVRIQSDNGEALAGAQLSRVMVFAAMREKGMNAIIMIIRNDSTIEVLAVPSGVQIVESANSKGAKDFHKDVRSLYTYKAGTTVYASPDHIMATLKLDYVEISGVMNLLKALNALAAKEDLSGLDVNELADLDTIAEHLQDQESKQSKKHFLQTLMAASISCMDMGKRIECFNKNPSYTLANNLELRLPHSGTVFTRLGNKVVTKVALSSLKPEEAVLMSTNLMSQKDYKNIMGNVTDYLVYKDTEDVGGRKGQRFANMSVKFRETASNVTSYLTAIATANGEAKSVSFASTTETDDTALNQIVLD